MSFFRVADRKNNHQDFKPSQHIHMPEIYLKKPYDSLEERIECTKGYHVYYHDFESFYLESIQGMYRYDCGSAPIGIIYETGVLIRNYEHNEGDTYYRKKLILKLCHESSKAAEAAASMLSTSNEIKKIHLLSDIYPCIIPTATTSAAYSNHTQLMNQLIKKGGCLDDALKGAIIPKNIPLCKELIDRGAKIEILKDLDQKLYTLLELSIDIIKQLKEYYQSTGFLTMGRDHRVMQIKQECISAKTDEAIASILENAKTLIPKEKKDSSLNILLIKLLRQIKGKTKLSFLMADHYRIGKQSPAYGSFFHNDLFDKNTLPLIFDFAEDKTKPIETNCILKNP